MPPEDTAIAIAERLQTVTARGKRRLIALVGPPASGKSTLAEMVAAKLPDACVVPMDGFHLDDSLLKARGLLKRKGAPDTFDVSGLCHLVQRLKDEDEVIFPVFDRQHEQSIAGAGLVTAETRTVIVEGNYLLLNAPGWRALSDLWDFTVLLDVPQATLRDRLMARWAAHGFSEEDAAHKTDANDLPNARAVTERALPADMVVDNV
ncbi:MAG: nucleoside/nucleotide kinase family protein [Roseobacter sp.]